MYVSESHLTPDSLQSFTSTTHTESILHSIKNLFKIYVNLSLTEFFFKMADCVGAKFVMITFSSAVERVRRCAVSVTLTSRSLGFFFLFKRQSPLFVQCELSHNIVLSKIIGTLISE